MYTSRVSSIASQRSERSSLGPRKGTALLNISKRSANTSLNRSLQSSHLFEETGSHVVEGFGNPLPVLITETITLSDRTVASSVKLSNNGWAWFVSGRRLFMWKYKTVSGSRSNVSQCRELTLPSSDLAHKADLVCVILSQNESAAMVQPAAIAVSPEGLVRYWPSIAHEGSYLETSAELHGQECYSLTDVQPLGCILATTTSSLILLTTCNSNGGHNNIQCHSLKPPQGMLAGIGRRVSSFIFGSIPNHSTESKLSKVLSIEAGEPYDKTLLVLFGPNLQKWYLTDQEPEQFVYDCDLDRLVRENFQANLWGHDMSHCNEIKTWMIDMQPSSCGVNVLVAAVNNSLSQLVYFAIASVDTNNDSCPTSLLSFNILKYTIVLKENEDISQKYKLLCPAVGSPVMYIYTQNMILCLTADGDDPDKIEFRSQLDRILGSGYCDKIPLFFINSKGIVSLTPSHQQFGDISMSMNETVPAEIDLDASIALNMSSVESNQQTSAEDKTAVLKSALIHFIKRELKQCQDIINEHFPCTEIEQGSDSTLDVTVHQLSKNMIDDFPASDPRWAETYDMSSSKGPLIIQRHLEGKHKAHEYLITFLQQSGLLDRLHSVVIGNQKIKTKTLLEEHFEKLVGAIALRNVHSSLSNILDKAIKDVLANRQIAVSGKLTAQDHFYRQVSAIDDIVPAMVNNLTEVLKSDIPTREIVNHVSSINKVLLEMMQKALKFRASKNSEINAFVEDDKNDVSSATPMWTNSEGSQGLRHQLIKMHSFTCEHALNDTDDIQTRGLLLQQLVDLTDIILDGFVNQLQSTTANTPAHSQLQAQYTKYRHLLISPLMEVHQFDRAAVLAEKYCEFEILVRLCEQTDNQERLQKYMAQFANQGFTDYVYKWYLDEGKRGKLLKQSFVHGKDFAKFLSIHPTLSWVNHIQTENFGSAHQTLYQLADKESDYLSRKKTMLSLSKLSALVSNLPSDAIKARVEDINEQQDLILHQETLPPPVLESLGINAEDMRVMSPQQLIKMYVSEENTTANEYHFKKALDLLQYIHVNENFDDEDDEDEDANSLRLYIFCKAILRDHWEDLDTDSPLDSLKQTIFFRIIDLAYQPGLNLVEFLPSIDALLARQELEELSKDSSFQFLIKAGYEHISQFIS